MEIFQNNVHVICVVTILSLLLNYLHDLQEIRGVVWRYSIHRLFDCPSCEAIWNAQHLCDVTAIVFPKLISISMGKLLQWRRINVGTTQTRVCIELPQFHPLLYCDHLARLISHLVRNLFSCFNAKSGGRTLNRKGPLTPKRTSASIFVYIQLHGVKSIFIRIPVHNSNVPVTLRPW